MALGQTLLPDLARTFGADPDTVEAAGLFEDILRTEAAQGGSGQFSAGTVLPYLRAYRWHQLHPWALPAILVGTVLGIFMLGRMSK